MAEVDLAGKRVFIRSDLNVPMEGGEISDDTRIRASLAAYRLGLEKGAAVMATSHLGRPEEGKFSEADSLAPVAQRVSDLLGDPGPAVADRDAERGRRVAAEIVADGGKALFVEADVGHESACLAFIQQALERFGGLNLLVNNAGIRMYQTVVDAT